MHIWCLTAIGFAKGNNNDQGSTIQTAQQRHKSFLSKPLASSWRGCPVFSKEAAHTKPKLQLSSLMPEFRGTATKDTENLSSTSFSSCALTLSCEQRGKKTPWPVVCLLSSILRLPPSPIGGNAKKRWRAMNHCLDCRSIILPQQLSGIRESIAAGMMAWCCTLGHLCCWKCKMRSSWNIQV